MARHRAGALHTKGNEATTWSGSTASRRAALEVVDFHGVEEISRPYRSRSPSFKPVHASALDLESLTAARALLIATHDQRRRFLVRHGVVLEAEATEQNVLDEALPHRPGAAFELARFRTHCRTFVDSTLEAIIARCCAPLSPARSTEAALELPPRRAAAHRSAWRRREWVGRGVRWSTPSGGLRARCPSRSARTPSRQAHPQLCRPVQ